jgi:ABC-type nitrate/sulfonate/bicarbonate transport system substrate-binding protein
MRNFFKSADWIVLGLAVALAGCEGRSSAPPITLRIGVFQSQDFLPYFVMQEQGFDKKYGLSFTESPFAGGAAAIDAMAAGAIDMCPGVGIVPLLVAAERGLIPDKVVPVAANDFADPEHRGGAVIVARTVNSWKDLEGKKIGANARNSIGGAAIEARLKQEGVRAYSFVEIPFSNQGLAVAGGNLVAASMQEPYLTQSLLRGDGKLLDWVIGGPPLERTEFTTIVFSAEFHRRNPDGVKAFLRAHLAAARWINEHPDKARLVLARRMNLSADVAKKINLLHWPVDARTDPALLDQTQQVLLRAGLLQRPVDTRQLHDETLLAEVLKDTR